MTRELSFTFLRDDRATEVEIRFGYIPPEPARVNCAIEDAHPGADAWLDWMDAPDDLTAAEFKRAEAEAMEAAAQEEPDHDAV